MKVTRGRWTADFETTVDPDDCRVWAVALCNIDNPDIVEYANTIDEFMEWCNNHYAHIYFHNLKFDGEFIINWLFRHGFKHVKSKELSPSQFKTLISDMGMFYTLEFATENSSTIIYDSLKILPFSVKQVSKAFNLPISKLSIDYKAYREPGHVLTAEEKDYIKNDVQIVAMALKNMFDNRLTRMTAGSNALYDYKKTIGSKNFKRWFPKLMCDSEIRLSYKGGFTYLSPRFANKDVGEGLVLDANSMYPWAMYYCMLPFGEPVCYDGCYQPDKVYPLYVQMFRCNFELKPGHIPTVQIKHGAFVENEWLTSSDGEDVTLCMTNVDLELMKEHYILKNVEYIKGWKFMGSDLMFRPYIDKWMGVKIKATKEGNEGMRTLAKLMLNSLYGKFAKRPIAQSKIPTMMDGSVKYVLDKEEQVEPIYIPVATFITSYARRNTISNAQKCYDRFAYADTDSLHLIGTEIPNGLEIDDSKLGAWKMENQFKRARFIRQKCYIEDVMKSEKKINNFLEEHPELSHHVNKEAGTILNITCAGMPESCYQYVTWKNFTIKAKFKGKLTPKHVPGGIILADTEFTIKDPLTKKKKSSKIGGKTRKV